MDIESISVEDLYETFGYAGLLVYGWIGFAGLPLPNELIVMTNGYMASRGLFQPSLAFLCTYISIVTVLYVSFTVGRLMSNIYSRPLKNKQFQQSQEKLLKYGKKALALSVFIPGFRLLIPCAAGYSQFNYSDLVKYSLIPNFIWTSFYFTAGFFFFERLQPEEWQASFFMIGAAIVLCFLLFRLLFKKVKMRQYE
ncbi:hypothetical protein F9802_03815 [Bacillus aerolatus]|uniref:VTT domain-containing protein n=1 Tax=Bacillus aerolatus TaxID=2653354 RepID=A0A6I1FXG5_9BACI|nr:VTT domain-containing protein [Bacillus aerolatus]KAB7707848.1 hypothetical protein F9802_03815 [Bacillus aerolatus]